MRSFNIPYLYTILSYQTDTYLKNFSWKSIDFFFKKYDIAQTFYSCQMSMLKVDTSAKVAGKLLDLLKPKSYWSSLEDIARLVT